MDFGNASVKISAQVEGQAAVDKLNKSLGETGKTAGVSAKQTAVAFQQLPAQFTDVVTQLAGGANPFLVLIQQGGQVKDSFGGIAPAVRAILSVITPLRVAMTGVVGVVGAMGAAFFVSGQRAEDFSRALARTGNMAGVTTQKYQEMVAALERRGTNAGSARDLVSGAIGSGQFGPRSIQPAIDAMNQLRRITGMSADESAKAFGNMRENVLKWADDMNRSYRFLTPEVYKQIRAQQEQGDVEGAIVTATTAFTAAMQEREVKLSGLSKAWKAVKDSASSAWNAMVGVFEEESPEKRIQQIENELNALSRARVQSQGVAGFSGRQTPYEQALERELASLKANRQAVQDKAKAEAEAAAATQQAIEAEKARVALIGPSNTRLLIEATRVSQERVAALEAESDAVRLLRARDLIDEQTASDRLLAIRRRQVNTEADLIRQQIAIEQSREVTTGDPIQQQVAMAERANNLRRLQAELEKTLAQIPAAEAAAAIGDAERNTREAGEQFDKLQSFYSSAVGQLAQLRQENERDRVALIVDPVARQNAEVDRQIAEINDKYGSLAASLRRNILLAMSTGNETVADNMRRELAELQAEQEAAIVNANAKRPVTDWLEAAKRGFREWAATASDMAGQIKGATENALNSLADTLAEWVTTGKASFKDFARSVLADLAKIIIKQQLVNALKAGMNYFGFADGGAFAGGTRAFASGGVVNRPTLFPFADGGQMRQGLMGEAGPEAIMPLKRTASGALGVQVAGGGGGGTTNVQVNVNMASGQSDAQSESTAGTQLGRNIAAAVKQVLIQEQRPGGLLYA